MENDDYLIKNTKNTARFFTEQKQVAWVCLGVALAWGLYGLMGMPQRKDPDVPSRQAEIVVPWPGTKPEEIEQLVIKKIEQAVAQNQWATEIKSVARTGVASVQFELAEKGKYDTAKELDDIKTKLDAIHDLPDGAGPIDYIKDFGDTSALMLTIASPPRDEQAVAWLSQNMEGRIRQVRNEGKNDGKARVSIVVAYPTSIDTEQVDRAFDLITRQLVSQILVTGPKPFSGSGFTGVDVGTDLSDSDLLAKLKSLVLQDLETDEFHPDAWGATVIRTPANTRKQLEAAAGDKYTYRDLQDFANTIQRSVKTLDIVSKVDQSGTLDQAILLNYSQERLAQYNLRPSDVTNIIKNRNLSGFGGTINTPGRSEDVTVSGEFKSAGDLRDIIIKTSRSGDPLYLRDLVDISRTYETPPSFENHFTRRDANGKWIRTRAVTLSIQMRKGQHIDEFGKQIDVNLDSVKKTLPGDLVLARTSDQPLQVKDSVDLFSHSLIEAVILVVIVSWIGFMSWRTALLMACAMPITLAITFGVINTIGIDLQQVSIASLIIALGLLVDVPVVSGDAIERELSQGKERPIAAWLGPTKLFRTMAFATITNVVSYLPFLMLRGDTGKFLYSLPVVISCSLLAALLVSMTFVPLISSFLLRGKKETPIEERRTKGFTGWYFRTITKAIEHRKLCLVASLLVLVLGVVVFSQLKSQFFPKDLQYFSYLDVWLAEDSPLSATKETVQKVEGIVEKVSEQYGKDHSKHGKPKEVLESMTAFVGGGGPRFWSSATPEDRQTNYGEVILRTVDKDDTTDLLELLQPAFDKQVPGAIVDTRNLETGKPIGLPVQVRVSGENLPLLRAQAAKLKKIFLDIPLATRVRDDWGEESLKTSVDVDADRANLARVTNSDVSSAVQGALTGIRTGVLRDGDQQIPMLARLDMEERAQLSDLRSLYVFSDTEEGVHVPLQHVAILSLKPDVPQIRRFDQYRTITIQCWPRGEHLASEVISAAMPKLKEFQKELPNGFIFRFAGEYKDQVSGFGDLAVVLAICILAIYMALLAQFKNAIKPFIVFAAIPYGVVGAVSALFLMGQPFGFMAFLGVISLIGVIVSHIIVLFEFIEERREAGEELKMALIDAGILRLRPVLITVSATVIALFPLAAHGGPLWEPLCYAQIGGLTIATFITLGLVPILYSFVVLDLKLVSWGEEKQVDSRESPLGPLPSSVTQATT